jgi:hypothetical protein
MPKHFHLLLETEVDVLVCFRYIAQNPVKAGLCDRPEDWRWSDYRATAGLSPVPPRLNVEFAQGLFRPYGGYADFCNLVVRVLVMVVVHRLVHHFEHRPAAAVAEVAPHEHGSQ